MQQFTLQLVQSLPKADFTSSGGALLSGSAKVLQQLRQALAAGGISSALPITADSFSGSTGQYLMRTGACSSELRFAIVLQPNLLHSRTASAEGLSAALNTNVQVTLLWCLACCFNIFCQIAKAHITAHAHDMLMWHRLPCRATCRHATGSSEHHNHRCIALLSWAAAVRPPTCTRPMLCMPGWHLQPCPRRHLPALQRCFHRAKPKWLQLCVL
jgi:hypothetical protein